MLDGNCAGFYRVRELVVRTFHTGELPSIFFQLLNMSFELSCRMFRTAFC